MTIGEKIKQARKLCHLSQEQLAEKMCVSRSAIAKWETGKGLPDIENLKVLSKLLNISVDSLLDDQQALDNPVLREPYHPALYGRGCKKVKKDRFIRQKYPDAKIITLLGRQLLTNHEKILDNTLGFFTDAPFGIPDMIHSLRNLDKEFYLVEQDGQQFFVVITDTFLEQRTLLPPITDKEFTLDNWHFIRCAYEVE